MRFAIHKNVHPLVRLEHGGNVHPAVQYFAAGRHAGKFVFRAHEKRRCSALEHKRKAIGGAATGVMWADQKDVYKSYHPIKVYNPDAG